VIGVDSRFPIPIPAAHADPARRAERADRV